MSDRRKAIFFDIDGTIFDTKARIIPENTVRAIEETRQNGHLCFINTGRTKSLVVPMITDYVGFDGLLLGCGTMITYGEICLLHHSFSTEMSEKIIEELSKRRIDVILEGSDALFFMDDDAYHYKVFRKYASRYQDSKHPGVCNAAGRFDKFFAYTEDPDEMNLFMEEFKGELEMVDREEGYYEILPCGFSKATAIDFIVQKFGIPIEDTAAIGDSNNDLAMLEKAGTAIAMRRSSEAVLEMADYVTGDVERDGIRQALKWLNVIG